MKGSRAIHHRPYIPYNRLADAARPYICRLAPGADSVTLEWIAKEDGVHRLVIRKRGEESGRRIPITEATVTADKLCENTEYELFIESPTGLVSNVRLFITSQVPEGAVVINYLHPQDTQYDFSGNCLCSPSLVRLESGRLLAGMDLFAPKAGQNTTILFFSDDNGKNWRYLTDLHPFYWANLFLHKGAVYALGQTQEYGDLYIVRSEDEGESWSDPTLLFYGTSWCCRGGGIQHTPMQLTRFGGRLYTSFEYGNWGLSDGHLPGVLSVDEDADLMCTESWSFSELAQYNGKWKENSIIKGESIEGNLVVGPDGVLYDIMRYKVNEWLKMRVNTEAPDAPPEYIAIEEAPVTTSMFRIFPYKGKYLLITNRKTDETATLFSGGKYRNVLSAFVSEDLKSFRLVKDLIDFRDHDPALYGFQYPCCIAEEDGVRMTIRSAFNGAENFHNANYSLYYYLSDEEIMRAF
ncbi:MAG: exo-alpha-sialidase [Clostridia bacterium]|nr:exo-alpha-sialidase [Clostridia bacterium]